MSLVERRTKETIRHEYLIPNGSVWVEIGKAYAMAKRDIEDAGKDPSYDDAASITSDDENIIIYWEETK
ncbi:hypothetical protein [Glutamicibacter sp. MCAF14]|uniref:hypothetical protein n=1 Tax=Glutamicibacter sp. MCAF14 TaxID=3233043 RepID=UPI003F93DA95